MANKVSVNVWIPGLNTSQNYLIPNEMNVANAVNLITKILSDEYPQMNSGNRGHMLLQSSTGKALNNQCSMKQLGILNGEELIMI